MRLKRLDIYGFKTFADKTTLEFDEGITAIVGSNGVGKSNICDAMLWVLGEQSMRAIRSQSALDVIFNGTNGRKPINLAEVSITLDNSDKQLPIDFTEVTITRRIFRSGESEYLINKSKCRLRDITELFMDTGIGKPAYSFITQGEIDAVLSIRNEDRRELIEEVAGIQKYRQRRKEATRKLEATEKNVTRVADIIAELSRQRSELEYEAQKAARYQELSACLRQIEVDLLAIDYARRSKRAGRLANDLDNARSEAESLASEISKLDAEEEQLRLDLSRVQQELEACRQEAAQAQREADAQAAAEAVSRERHRSLVQQREALEAASKATSKGRKEFEARLESAREELSSIQQELDAADAAEAKQAEVLNELRRRLAEAQGEARHRREKLAQLRAMSGAREQNLRALKTVVADMEKRLEKISADAEAIARRRAETQKLANQYADRLHSLEEEIKRTSDRYERAQAKVSSIRELLQEESAVLEQLQRDVSNRTSRLAVLRELQESHEGYGEGVRRVATAYRGGQFPGLRGVVGELIDVPQQLEKAIEAALGSQLEWIIVNTQADAERGVHMMREGEPARATFIPIAAMGTLSTPVSAMLAGDEPHVLGPASRLVGYPRSLRRVFEYLLGDIVVVRDLDSAFRVKKRLGVAAKIVTLDGELVDRSGAITVGTHPSPAASALGRKRDIEKLTAEVNELREKLESAQSWVAQRTEELRHAEGELESISSAVTDLRLSLLEARKEHAYAEKELSALADSAAALAAEKSSLEAALRETRRKSGDSEISNDDAEKQERQLVASVAEVEKVVARLTEEANQAAEALSALRVSHASARERAQNLRQNAEQAEREINRLAAQEEQDARRLEELAAEIAQLEASFERRDGDDSGPRKRQQALESAVKQLVARRDQLQARLNEISDEVRAKRASLVEAQERARRTEISLTREQAEIAHLTQRLAEGYDLTPDEAVKQRDTQSNDREIAREARRLQAEIRALGPVSVGAVEEYDRLKRREEFLQSQKEDLDAARDDLLRVINEADQAGRAAFLEAFDAVEREFQAIFTHLFGGGKAELMLTHPEDLARTGVEVIVQPPGRKQQNLMVLSGGERALTAAALIFAMIRVRPTPFCVMDELDAPLDETNIHKYNELLREFAKDSQLILITHNPETMTAADRYLGVTMQEPGVSRVLTLNMKKLENEVEGAPQC